VLPAFVHKFLVGAGGNEVFDGDDKGERVLVILGLDEDVQQFAALRW
jgi:hypothetical protein